MATIKFTEAQQHAIDIQSGNVLVSAAAGSGKTAVLTERVLRLLTKEDPVYADALIIVTFTVAASVEMRQRIEQKLQEALRRDPQNELLQTQQLLLPKAKISTIHALCSGLIREHFHLLSLPPKFRLADSTEVGNLQAEQLQLLLEAQYQEKSPAFLALSVYFTEKDDSLLAQLIEQVYQFILKQPFSLSLLPQYLNQLTADSYLDSELGQLVYQSFLRHQIDHALQLLCMAQHKAQDEGAVATAYGPALQEDVQMVRCVKQALEEGDWDGACTVVKLHKKPRLSAVRNFDDPEMLQQIKDLRGMGYDKFDKIADSFLCVDSTAHRDDQQTLKSVLTTLFSLVARYHQAVAEQKRQLGILDYNDLEHLALQLLVQQTDTHIEKTAVATALSAQYAEVLVDECQDINRLQNLIFWALCKGTSSMPIAQSTASADNLFMVGDVKQSIYRFRNAVPELFVQKRKTFAEDQTVGTTILLQENFRSRDSVTEPINHLFSRAMTARLGGLYYTPEEALKVGATFTPCDRANTELHLLEVGTLQNGEHTLDYEADYIATMIQKMVRERYPVQTKAGMRPCTYRDFCILLRSRKGKVERYLSRLQQKNIPCFAESNTGYFNAPEIVAMLQLLRVIDNPMQDIALFAVLTSPLFCFTDDKVVAMRLQQRKGALYFGLLELAKQDDYQCNHFLSVLQQFRDKAALLPIDRLIQYIYDHTGFLSLMQLQSSGDQKRANLCLLLHYAEQYQALGGYGVDGFLRYIDRSIARKEDFSSANVLSSQANVVQIMTIHGSKGLEFPICILADLAKPFNQMDSHKELLCHPRYGVAVQTRKPATHQKYSNLLRESLRVCEQQESKSEEMRVLYVAMTRAKEKLILVGTDRNMGQKIERIASQMAWGGDPANLLCDQRSMIDWLIAGYSDVVGFSACYHTPQRTEVPCAIDFFYQYLELDEEVDDGQVTFEVPADPALLATLQAQIAHVYPDKPLTLLPAKVTATKLAKQDQGADLSALEPMVKIDGQALDGAARGTILHAFMQYADFARAKQDLNAEIDRLVARGFLQADQARVLYKKSIYAFLKSDLYRRIESAVQAHREYAFLYGVEACRIDQSLQDRYPDEQVLLQGIADLVLVEADGVTIVDYKTDRLTDPAEFIERYAGQLALYRQALADYFDRPIKQCLIYALSIDQTIEIPV